MIILFSFVISLFMLHLFLFLFLSLVIILFSHLSAPCGYVSRPGTLPLQHITRCC